MERGEEEASTGRRDAYPITNFADVKARRLPTSERRERNGDIPDLLAKGDGARASAPTLTAPDPH